MERILKASDIAQRYRVSPCTARKYMRLMDHMENPLSVYESSLLQWEYTRMTSPGVARRQKQTKRPPVTQPTGQKKRFIISRVREVTP